MIRAPDGWQTVPPPSADPGRVELLSIALGPVVDGFHTNINVIRDLLDDPSETMAARAKESVSYMSTHNGGKIVASHAQKVCSGARDGWYFETSDTYNSRRVTLEQTLLLDGGYEYVATYTRASGSPADPSAIRALTTLCPQPT